MIRTATQLKAKVRNLSGGDSGKALTLIRNYVMERFLERAALSGYRDRFILKGGILVSSLVGLDTRTTMDIDAAFSAMLLSKESAIQIVNDIIAVEIPDGVWFKITKVTDIMEEHDYPGVRVFLEASLEKMQQTIKIDLSAGDVITPGAVEYSYPLMFEERFISLWTYNLETLLAEKLETIMARGTANTRMRDFYDIHVLTQQKAFDSGVFRAAFRATSGKRKTTEQIQRIKTILENIETDDHMRKLWENYREESFYVGEISWTSVMASVKQLGMKVV